MDISFCDNESCELKETCRRWVFAQQHNLWSIHQSFISGIVKNGKCEDYEQISE